MSMSRKHRLNAKMLFSFFGAGRFYWRFAILPFAGVLMALAAHALSVDGSPDDPFLPLSFSPLFLTVFLIILCWTSTQIRDNLLGNKSMDLFIQWPLNRKMKMILLLFFSTWLPATLLLIGAYISIFSFARHGLWTILPFAIFTAFIISVLIWKGSFTTVDVGSFPGKVSYKEETWLSLTIFFICLSPLLLIFLPLQVLTLFSLVMALVAALYGMSMKNELQTAGSYKDTIDGTLTNCTKEKSRKVVSIDTKKSSFFRYFLFLEWDLLQAFYFKPFSIKKILFHFLVSFKAGLFIVIVYYSVTGLFNPSNDLLVTQRAAYTSLLITYSIFFSHWTDTLVNNHQKLTLLFPVSLKQKSLAILLNKILRPLVYTFICIVAFSLILVLIHKGLSNFMEQDIPPYWELTKHALLYSFVFIPFSITILSFFEFLHKLLVVTLQGFSSYKGAAWLSGCSFFVSLIPFILIMTIISQNFSRIYVLMSHQALIVYAFVFILSRLGLHWTMKKVQVISS